MNLAEQKLYTIILEYNNIVGGVDTTASASLGRAYGGIIRSQKGSLVENIAANLVRIAWQDVLHQDPARMEINKKKMPIGINNQYIDRITDPNIREYVRENKEHLIYKFGTDVQVFIDGQLVLPIECKAYSENAMLKRILFDAFLMKEAVGTQTYYLVQLESQLGGDYSELNDITYGSPATHALLSHIDVDLKIITLLKGERKVDRPIHKPEFFKELTMEELKKAVTLFAGDLMRYAR